MRPSPQSDAVATGLRDPRLDLLTADERTAWIQTRIRAQIAHIEAHELAFWRERLARHGVHAGTSIEGFAALPPLTKQELRELAPWELVPRGARSQIERCYGTSGTTGKPVSLLWTEADWRALAETVARMLLRHRIDGHVLALNGYHQGHLAGQVYQAALQRLGGQSLTRHYRFDDEDATLEQLRAFGCNTLVLAERSGMAKGGKSIEDLLRREPALFQRHGIRWWIGSSTTFTARTRAIAAEQGVEAVTNLYGSSELGMLAVACRADPEHFHTAQGHALVEVVDGTGRPVRSGERGRVVVSLLAALDDSGALSPRAGSQLLRFDNGDEATCLTGSCACGMTTPRLYRIGRRASA